MDFPDSSFHKIYSIEVLQHVHCKKHAVDVLREFYRLTKPGGVCLTMDYSWRGKGKKESTYGMGLYRYRFSAEEIQGYFFQAGFIAVKCFPAMIIPNQLRVNKLIADFEVLFSLPFFSNLVGGFLITVGRRK